MQRAISFTIVFLITILSGHKTVGQEIKVISSFDNSPLPYATVTNHTYPSVTSCNKEGLAKLTAFAGDTISVSYVGYKTAVIRFSDKTQIVRLVPDQKLLPVITLHSCRKPKEFHYNNFDDYKKLQREDQLKGFSRVIWSKAWNTNGKFAVRLSPLKANAVLKDFSFWIEKDENGPPSSVHSPLLISLYEASDSTHLPGELISQEPIIYFPKKAGKQTIEFDTLHVSIPSNGIYLSIQYIMNEEYEWKHETKWKDHKEDSILRDTVIIRYGGVIPAIRTKDFDFVHYNGIKDRWFTVGGQLIPDENLHTTIKCEFTIKYCEDK
jgi:hypothetical protein